jgi:hypothetical protein
MRERTTWNRDEIVKQASMPKKADPYTMNQDHKDPPASKYLTGTPSSFGEDVASPDWEKETKREDIGLPVLKPGKTATENALLVKKADLCVKVARAMLGKKASEDAVEDQAVAFMALADGDLIDTFNRLAQDDQAQQDQGQAEEPKQAQQEQDQSQQAPPAQQQQAQQQDQQQAPAPEQQMSAAEQCMAAMQSGDQAGVQAALQQMVQEAMQQQAPAEQAPEQAPPMQAMASSKKKAQQDGQQSQGQQSQDQKQAAPQMDVAGMIQTAIQAHLGQQQAPADQSQDPMQAQASDQMLLDEMLAPGGSPDMGAPVGDIELESSPMDVGEVGFGPEDDALKMLFANDDSQAQQEIEEQSQGKQASVRTASTRTVGTKPTAGVSRVGGFGGQSKQASAGGDVDKLASLWSSAPDVREHFGIK